MGSRSFQGQTVFLGGSGEILEFLEWLEGLGAKYKGSCKIWEFFKDFLSVWSGLGPMCKYFSETEGAAVKFTYAWGLRHNLQQVQELGERFI
jgi:hypothetical protein